MEGSGYKSLLNENEEHSSCIRTELHTSFGSVVEMDSAGKLREDCSESRSILIKA